MNEIHERIEKAATLLKAKTADTEAKVRHLESSFASEKAHFQAFQKTLDDLAASLDQTETQITWANTTCSQDKTGPFRISLEKLDSSLGGLEASLVYQGQRQVTAGLLNHADN